MKMTNATKATLLSMTLLCSSLVYADSASDATLVSSIKTQFAADKMTSDLHVNVSSEDGVITLSGKVNTDAEADKLIQIADATPGVSDVKTIDLTVKGSSHEMTDTTITAKVKAMYIREKLFHGKDISVMGVIVETTNGTVYLSGSVDTQEEADNAVKYAKKVPGVKKVESKLEVKSST